MNILTGFLGVTGLALLIAAMVLHFAGASTDSEHSGDVPSPTSAEEDVNAHAPQPVAAPVRVSETDIPGHAEIMRMLKTEGARRKVYWRVWCTAFYEGDEEKFSGIATAGKEFNIYQEDGAGAYWAVHDYKTPDEAAYALARALQGEPNAEPMHKDIRRRTECLMPIVGTP